MIGRLLKMIFGEPKLNDIITKDQLKRTIRSLQSSPLKPEVINWLKWNRKQYDLKWCYGDTEQQAELRGAARCLDVLISKLERLPEADNVRKELV